MSGMSMDGIDLACTDIEGIFPNLKVQMIGTYFLPFTPELKARLIDAQSGNIAEASSLNVIVANEFSKCVLEFLKDKNLTPDNIDAIGSHGQTLFHATGPEVEIESTFQIGSPSIISENTGILTIGNFRVRDIAGGGRGAPLVSIADYILFRDPNGVVAFNNLGSISNVTVVTPLLNDMLAFDTGPANMAIDFYARMIPGNIEGIDSNGSLAGQGKCIPGLLSDLLNHSFFDQSPPKSAGYDEFGPSALAKITQSYLEYSHQDLLCTAVEFSAVTIENAYRKFVIPKYPELKKIIFSGGGIYNKTLMKRIKELLPEMNIETLKNELSDAKEALAFALLANETLSGRPGSLSSITGVKHPTILGELAL
jgi:anhydro-N-acetylmuramic acid kinase